MIYIFQRNLQFVTEIFVGPTYNINYNANNLSSNDAEILNVLYRLILQ